MNWWRAHRRTAWVCGLTLVLPAYLFLHAFFGLWGKRAEYQSDIDYLMPRIARMQGLLDQQDTLRQSHARAATETAALIYPVSEDHTAVAAQLQNSVRQLLSRSGLSVSNSQVLPLRQRGSFDYVAVRVSVTGSLDALDAALAAIGTYQPLLLIESLDVRPSRKKRNAPDTQSVSATLQLLSLRSRQ